MTAPAGPPRMKESCPRRTTRPHRPRPCDRSPVASTCLVDPPEKLDRLGDTGPPPDPPGSCAIHRARPPARDVEFIRNDRRSRPRYHGQQPVARFPPPPRTRAARPDVASDTPHKSPDETPGSRAAAARRARHREPHRQLFAASPPKVDLASRPSASSIEPATGSRTWSRISGKRPRRRRSPPARPASRGVGRGPPRGRSARVGGARAAGLGCAASGRRC